MLHTDTNHQSFILKPSTLPDGGVGVFVLHDVATGTRMELFSLFSDYRQLEAEPKEGFYKK